MRLFSRERRAKRYGLWIKWRCGFPSALLSLLAIFSPSAQTAQAVDLHYAGAIGQDFLPEPSRPDARPAPDRTTPPPVQSQSHAPDLPALGTSPSTEKATATGMSIWTKLLIGVAVVGTMAALGNKGGGGGEATVSSDGPANTGGTSTPPPSAGGPPPPQNNPSPPPAPSTPAPGPIAAPPPPAPPVGGGEDDRGRNRGRK